MMKNNFCYQHWFTKIKTSVTALFYLLIFQPAAAKQSKLPSRANLEGLGAQRSTPAAMVSDSLLASSLSKASKPAAAARTAPPPRKKVILDQVLTPTKPTASRPVSPKMGVVTHATKTYENPLARSPDFEKLNQSVENQVKVIESAYTKEQLLQIKLDEEAKKSKILAEQVNKLQQLTRDCSCSLLHGLVDAGGDHGVHSLIV